jgi:hypothetical protein
VEVEEVCVHRYTMYWNKKKEIVEVWIKASKDYEEKLQMTRRGEWEGNKGLDVYTRERVRVLVERIGGGTNLLSWRDSKTRKLGDCCARETNGDTLDEARIYASIS